MNIRTVCLAILYEEDSTGYDIRSRCVEGECAYFLEASFGSIYPALAKLEADKLVSSTIKPQHGKPARKVYSITEAGRAAFVDALFEPMGDDLFRSPFLLFARFVHLLPQDLVRTRVQEQYQRDLDRRQTIERYADEKKTATDHWILDFGRAMLDFKVRYMADNKDRLIALAGSDIAKKDAAE